MHLNDSSKKNDQQKTTLNANVQVYDEELINSESNSTVTSHNCDISTQVLLSTAIIKILDNSKNFNFARALIDQSSQASFITESLFQRRHLKFKFVDLPISGVSGKSTFSCKKSVNLLLQSRFDTDFSLSFEAYVISKITSYSPTPSSLTTVPKHLNGLNLADPRYFKRSNIEVLLGASVHASIIKGEARRCNINEPSN